MLRPQAKENRRRAILAAAAKRFASRPFADVLLDDVAAEAGIAKGTVYLYFESKEQLYLTLIQDLLAPLIEELSGRVEQCTESSAWVVLQAMVRRLLVFSYENPSIQEVLRVTSLASREAVLQELSDRLLEMLRSTIERGVAQGELSDADPDLSARFILALVGKCSTLMTGPDSRGVDQMADQVLNFFGAGLLSRQGVSLASR
jgi:AcrR family transcriptional regulator